MRCSPARLTAVPGAAPLGAIFAAIGATAVLAVGVLHLDRLGVPVCVFKAVTGWPCLTCGATRALAHIWALDPLGAFAMNPLVMASVLALLPWGLADLALLPSRRALSLELSPSLARWARTAAVVAAVANWVYLVAAGR